MQRKLSTWDFERAGRTMKNPEETGLWSTCDGYEIQGNYITAKWPREERSHWTTYSPLEKTPELYLKLAALIEEPDFSEAALNFCCEYGIPSSPERTDLSELREETESLWLILRIYEAALNRDEAAIEAAGKIIIQHVLKEPVDSSLDETPVPGEHSALTLAYAVYDVNNVVREHCCQLPYFTESFFVPDSVTSGIRSVWTFDSLFAAAYLQMWWLMTSGGELSRCKYCRRTMSLSLPRPGGRKRRRDKRFCSDSCRQAHHRSKK